MKISFRGMVWLLILFACVVFWFILLNIIVFFIKAIWHDWYIPLLNQFYIS